MRRNNTRKRNTRRRRRATRRRWKGGTHAVLQQFYDAVDSALQERNNVPLQQMQPITISASGCFLNVRFGEMRYHGKIVRAVRIYSIQVAKEARGQGGMTTVLKKLVQFARANHFDVVTMESVNPSSAELLDYLSNQDKRQADGLGFQKIEADPFSFEIDERFILLLD